MGVARSTYVREVRTGCWWVDPRPLERPRYRWDDNIKMRLQEVGGGMDRVDLVLDRGRWR